jgi:hypothetical protein
LIRLQAALLDPEIRDIFLSGILGPVPVAFHRKLIPYIFSTRGKNLCAISKGGLKMTPDYYHISREKHMFHILVLPSDHPQYFYMNIPRTGLKIHTSLILTSKKMITRKIPRLEKSRFNFP